MNEERDILCAASAYQQKYYFNDMFSLLPQQVKDELQALCVLFTEEVGGVLTLYFDEEGALLLETDYEENDFSYDEISAGLKISRLRREKEELFSSLELFYQTFCKEGV